MQTKWQIEDLSKEIKKIRDEISDIVSMRASIMRQYESYEENPVASGVDENPSPRDPKLKGSRCAAFGSWTEIREDLN